MTFIQISIDPTVPYELHKLPELINEINIISIGFIHVLNELNRNYMYMISDTGSLFRQISLPGFFYEKQCSHVDTEHD